jgi:small-conductance mechanosensitive channel
VFYLLSLFCNLFGYFDLNILLLKVGIHIPVYTIVFFGIYRIWIALTSATLMVAKNRKQTYLTHYWEKMEMRILQFVRLFLVFFWIYSVIVLFELGAPTYLWMSDFMLKEHTIGNLHISLWAVVAFVLIVLFTFLLTGIIRFVVDDEFISRSKLPKGVLHAISVSIRYIIVFIGIMFALSMAGIDLGKFSLLAGALGVGIGFGLQNIVNNFISGLILIYERPLQVGDTIEIESLMGRVTTIGPRSSHVVTYDGAEVVVPNGNLISNQLINWTLSDNKRRLEVKIGAAYESDPNIVIKILQEVADENQNIFKEPEPLALFDGFGESSLNFRLLFWIPFELGLQAKSDVSVAIYNKFKENNIEIPFPQMDLHVKSKPEDLE